MRKEIDILKAIAVLAVVFLHFNSNLFYHVPHFSDRWNLTLFIDQILRFCVPLFVFISGYTLAKKYLSKALNLKDFYLRRVTKILPQYFWWSAIIFLTLQLVPNWHSGIWNFLIVDYHLYFVPMIFQLYLLFPVLLFLIKKFKIIPLILTLFFQIIIYWYFSNHLLIPDQEQYIFAGSWIFFFVLGIFLANYEPKKIPLILIFSGVIFSFSLMLFDSFNLLSKNLDVIVAARSTRFSVLLYATSFIFFLYYLKDKFLLLPKTLINIFAFVGQYSFTIYLSHTLFLRVIFEPQYNSHWSPLLMALVILITLMGILIPYFYHQRIQMTRQSQSQKR